MADDAKVDALGLPYKPRPLPKQPTRSLLNGMAYRDAASTNVAATIRRVKREQKRQQELETARREQAEREAHTVVPLQRKGRNG